MTDRALAGGARAADVADELEDAIAIIGMAGRFPGAADLAAFWRNLRDGVESVRSYDAAALAAMGVDPGRLQDPAFVPAAGLMDGIEDFDPSFFGLSRREAEVMDPQQRLLLECAWEALEDAAYDPTRYPGAIGVFTGVGMNGYLLTNLFTNPQVLQAVGPLATRILNEKDFVATRVSYHLNLRGPGVCVLTACSTSLVAVHMACQSLLNFECDQALAGGVTIPVPHVPGYVWQQGSILAPDGHCRAFDARAQGTVPGAGVGLVVLKRLEDALDQGDRIYAVIRGTAINNDGAGKVGFTAPSVDGQAAVITAAQAAAGVEPGTITLIEAHGTATNLGDPIEVAALTKVFRRQTEAKGFCALGSVKSNIGHADAAAGVAGLLKATLALVHRTIPPSLHFERPNPELGLDESPFYVPTEARAWHTDGTPRRAGVSSFGIGGTNAHAVLEQAPATAASEPGRAHSLLVLSARTPAALRAAGLRLADALQDNADAPLEDAAFTLQVGRRRFACCRSFVARDRDSAICDLRHFGAQAGEQAGERRGEVGRGGVAFLFPGQGLQHPRMGAGLYRHEPSFRAEVDRCCAHLAGVLDVDLRRAIFDPAGAPMPADELANTALAQPALFVVEYALARLWMEWGVTPAAMLGHSLGEYVAACLAGVFSLEDALSVVAIRGRAMQAAPRGAMLWVGEGADALRARLPQGVTIAVEETATSAVASGPSAAIQALAAALEAAGIRHRELRTSHAFHNPLIAPALEPLRARLRQVKLSPPRIPFVSNRSGTWIRDDEAVDIEYWCGHALDPVRIGPGLDTLAAHDIRVMLEVGPGRSMGRLVGGRLGAGRDGLRALASLPGAQEASQEKEDTHQDLGDQQRMLATLGRLWELGFDIDWDNFHRHARRQRMSLPTYPFERQRCWVEPGDLATLAARAGAAHQAKPDPAVHGAPAPAPAPDDDDDADERRDRPHAATAPAAADTGRPVDAALMAIWREVLGHDQVRPDDDFFELGGSSLLLPQVLDRVRERFGVDIPIAEFLRAPRLADLARRIDQRDTGKPSRPTGAAGQGAQRDQGTGTASAGDLVSALRTDAQLDPAITMPPARPAATAASHGLAAPVLLTGATGFLGAFLLDTLLRRTEGQIHCIVRADSVDQGWQRLRAQRQAMLLDADIDMERVRVHCGDITRPHLGLDEASWARCAEHIARVYHCAAWVNFTYPYEALRASNVAGVREVIRLAMSGRPKALHLMSTVAALAPSLARDGIIPEDFAVGGVEHLHMGYGQSKWVAEQLAVEAHRRGLDVTIYRPDVIGGHSVTGACGSQDMIWALIRGCVQLGVAPDVDGAVQLAGVDYVTEAMCALSLRPNAAGMAYHLLNPEPLQWRALFALLRAMGYQVETISAAAWTERLRAARRDNALAPFLPLMLDADAHGAQPGPAVEAKPGQTAEAAPQPVHDCRQTRAVLDGLGIHCPPTDKVLRASIARMADQGLLPALPA